MNRTFIKYFFVFIAITNLFSQNFESPERDFRTQFSDINLNDINDDVRRFSDEKITSTLETDFPDPRLAMSFAEYPVTAGDVYTLAYAMGTTPVSFSIPVDSSYQIRIANLGVINCKNLTYLQLKQQVVSLVQKNYPMGGTQFVLTSPSSFIVSISGEVTETVEKNAWALTRLSSLISDYYTPYSSTRNIKVISSDGSSKVYDLFKFSREGDLSQDPYLRPGDKIVVGRVSKLVSISGAVERPGFYELLENENLRELVQYYGNGLTHFADISRIELYRQFSKENGAGEKIYLSKKDFDSDYKLVCFDSVYISNYKEVQSVVYIEGAIDSSKLDSSKLDSSKLDSSKLDSSNKLSLSFNKGENYAFFVRRIKNIFVTSADTKNAYVIRNNEYIPLDIDKILYDSSYYSDLIMQANDTLIIPFRQYFVSVSGAVNKPGRYPYIPDRDWEYYIGLAGGFIKTQNSMEAVTITDMHGNKLSKKDKILPETTIEAKTNSGLFYFNQYAPVLTTILSLISTSISVLVVSGAL